MLVKALIAGVFALCFFTGCGATAPPGTGAPCPVAVALVGGMTSPAAGSIGVSPVVGSVSFSVSDARFLGGSLTLFPKSGGESIQGGTIGGTAASATASVPALQAMRTYSLEIFANFSGSPCTQSAVLGSFTTGP